MFSYLTKKTLIQALVLLLVILAVYIYLAGRLNFDFPTEPANYFSFQTQSFFQGRLDLFNPNWDHDLSKFNDKLYMYWGPTPILLIFPFVLFFGVNTSDVLYTAIVGAFTPLIFFLILNKLNHLELTRLTDFKKILLTLFFAFGTVYFSVAVRGGVWFTSQTVTTLFILLSILFMLYFITKTKVSYLILSALFLGLAVWGRSTFIFYLPFLLALISIKKIRYQTPRPKLIRDLVSFFGVLAIIFLMMAAFNYLRFGSFLESGYSYQEAAQRFIEDKGQYGFINLHYLPHNFEATILSLPKFINKYPYFDFNGEGNSFIALSPLFFLILLIVKKNYWENKTLRLFNSSIILGALLIIFLQLLFWGTGWFQFSARYMLDAVPLFLFVLAETLSERQVLIILVLTSVSIMINTLGALWLIGAKL